MVSAAGQTAAIPLKRTSYDKRLQDNILTLMLRKINETVDSSSLLLKYQQFRELIAENKTGEINHFIDRFNKEISGFKTDKKSSTQTNKSNGNRNKNTFINSTHFKRLFPQADVLFEFSEYGVAARETLRENITGDKKMEMEFLPTSTFFKKQSYFKGILVERYSDVSFDGFKGLQLDFYY